MWLNHIFYNIDRWLPAEWPELDESCLRKAVERLASEGRSWVGALDKLVERQTHVNLLRAASCLFWHVFYWPERFTAGQLEELVDAWRYEYKPDETPDWTRAYVSVHVSGALALHLYKTEKAFSEAMREAVDNITQLAAYLKAMHSLIEPWVYYADDPQYFNETVPIRKSLPIACSLGWCFDFYIARADGKPELAFNSAFEAFKVADVANSVRTFFTEPRSAIEHEDVTLALVAMWMLPHDIAEVFDQIHTAVESKVDWAQLAAQCDEMGFYHERALKSAEENRFHIDRFVTSEIGKLRSESGSEWSPFYPLREFWTFARGLCVTRLSPDAYRKLREDDERHAAEERLRKYFFVDLWDVMPQETKDALITADRIYWSTEGRKGDILENLRLAIEPIVEQQLATPFRSWCFHLDKQTPTSSDAVAKEPFLPLSRLLRELWANRGLFENFARAVFPGRQAAFWNELRESLYKLRDLRGAAVHPEDRGPATTDQALEQYRRFVGIDERGILSDLLGLRPQKP